MKIAVLGGTRFIGPFIVRNLVRQGHQVDVYHRGKTVHKFSEDVRHVTIDREIKGQTAAALKENRPDAVIDMCGYWPEQLKELMSAGLDLQHYVFCSTTAVYGQIGKNTPDEKTMVNAQSDYECGKVACEKLLLSMHQAQQLPVTILRLAHPYGPAEDGQPIYVTGRESLFLGRIRRGRPIIIPGRGDTRIHPIYVEDAAAAFSHVLGRSDCVGRIFNLAGNEVLSLNEYFASIARTLGSPLMAYHIPVAWFEANQHLWSGKKRKFDFAATWCRYETAFNVTALRNTGFKCRVDHDRGIAATVAWLDEHGMIPSFSDHDLEDSVEISRASCLEEKEKNALWRSAQT